MVSSTPFFSVVIPTLNEELFLPRLLSDLATQKEKDFEVFVVDGQSKDKTVSIADTFTSKLALTVYEVKKSNVSTQRNFGARHARGDYLIFFDADVQVSTTFLKQLKVKLQNTRPDYATTYVRADSIHVQDKLIATGWNMGMEMSLFVEKPFIPGFNFIVAREVFKKVNGFKSEVTHGEDYELAMRLYNKGFTQIIYKTPQLIFSLRRYREEGRLAVMRKHMMSTLHIHTKGDITKSIFPYEMGGGQYNHSKSSKKSNSFEKMELYVKKFLQLFE